MKLYAVTDEYINYLRQFDNKVYDNKEDKRTVMRKYLGIVFKIKQLNYYTCIFYAIISSFVKTRLVMIIFSTTNINTNITKIEHFIIPCP